MQHKASPTLFKLLVLVLVCGEVSAFNIQLGITKVATTAEEPAPRSEGSEIYLGYKFSVELVVGENGGNKMKFLAAAPSDAVAMSSTDGKFDGLGTAYTCDVDVDSNFFTLNDSNFTCLRRIGIDRDIREYETAETESLGLSFSVKELNVEKKSKEKYFKNTTSVFCAPLRAHECGTMMKNEGICYLSQWVLDSRGDGESTGSLRWATRNPCREKCPTENIDMMFVIDGSDSVKKENFQKVKSWIQRVVQDFDTANRTQVGVIQYSYYGPERKNPWRFIETEIEMSLWPDKEVFNKKVEEINYHGYQTFTFHALDKTVREDFNGKTSRYPNANRVLILLTDGKSSDPEYKKEAMALLEAKDVIRFAVGVGDYNITELRTIASSDDYVMEVKDFTQLKDTIKRLQTKISGSLEGSNSGNKTNKLSQCEVGMSSTFNKVSDVING